MYSQGDSSTRQPKGYFGSQESWNYSHSVLCACHYIFRLIAFQSTRCSGSYTQTVGRVGTALPGAIFSFGPRRELLQGSAIPALCKYIRYHQESHYISSRESAKIIALPSVFLDILK